MINAFLVGWALVAAAFSGVAVMRLLRRREAPTAPIAPWPPVLLLRPLDAPSAQEVVNLGAAIDYPGPLDHVVLAPCRPPLGPDTATRWWPSDPLTPNRKVGHLVYGLSTLPRPEGAVVLAVDADVRVDGALVKALVTEIRRGSAVASAAPSPVGARAGVGSAVRALLLQTHHSFRALDAMALNAKAVCGKAMAFSPAALDELPGLAQCIGEDLELSQRLHGRGLAVSLASTPAIVPVTSSPTVAAAHERFTRWMKVLRAHRPALFPSVPLLFACTPLLLVLALVAGGASVWWALAALLVARIALACVLDGRRGLAFEWLLAEVLLLSCWVTAALSPSSVRWRGRTYVLKAGGVMS